MSGEKSKVIQFPTATRKKIDYPSLNDTITEQSLNLKESRYWIQIIGSLIGTTIMFTLFYFTGKVIHG